MADNCLCPFTPRWRPSSRSDCAPAADLVTVVTESNRHRLTQLGVSKSRVVGCVQYPGLQPMPLRSDTASDGRLNLVYAGMLTRIRRQGLEQLLKALEQIGPAFESFRLHIAGDGSESGPLRALVSRLGLRTACNFTGGFPNSPRSLSGVTWESSLCLNGVGPNHHCQQVVRLYGLRAAGVDNEYEAMHGDY